MFTAIDLFSGFGGWTRGGVDAGLQILWAANHWPAAVEWHTKNNPDTQHVCLDLHQADWSKVPKHDAMLASPCCQGHTKARGKESGNPQHDNSRSTAWAPVVNAEVNYRHENHSETKKAYAVKRKPLIFMVPKPGSNIPPKGRYFTEFTYY
jgi:DNA (cytosine-5)-methyltransferase 1